MLDHLLSPVQIGSTRLPNRIAMAAMGVEIVDSDGHAREPVIAYYEERAKGGAGLIITEVCAVAYPQGANSDRQLALSRDEYLPGLREMTSRVQQHGARIAAQLVHHGKVSRLDVKQGREVLMPSIPEWHGEMTMGNDLTADEIGMMVGATGGLRPKFRAATKQDIDGLIDSFADATERARRAGFDGVELHAAHGYILSEFLSPQWNRRDDEYGGPIENRARLLCDVLRACKQRAGDDFTVWCRLDAKEFRTPNGIVFEDAKQAAKLAQEAGADAIHLTAYADATSAPGFTEAPLVHEEAGYVEMTSELKRELDVPVIAVGRIEPELGDRLVREGKADVIAMARKMLADPHIARKLAEDRAADVRPCIYCYTCVAQAFFDERVRCAVNPVTAKEASLADVEIERAAQSKRVLIVGGGPAGMEAARVAAARGHDVTLCEKSAQLGGTLRFASLVYEPNERLLRWMVRQVERSAATVRLETAATPELVRELSPDVVLVAVGSSRHNPAIPGIDRPHVFDGEDLRAMLTGEGTPEAGRKLSLLGRLAVRTGRAVGITSDPGRLRQASRAYMPIGRHVVILGGGLVGCELAEFLHARGREVTVLEETAHLATAMAHPRRWRILYELRESGVELVTNATLREVTDDAVHYELAATDESEAPIRRAIRADSVIVATGLAANPEAVQPFEGLAPSVEAIGDCTGVGYLEGAIHDAFRVASEL